MRPKIFIPLILLTLSLEVLSADIQPATHSLKTPYPGKTALPFWGVCVLHASSFSSEYINEASRYGANLLLLLLHASHINMGNQLDLQPPSISAFQLKGFLVKLDDSPLNIAESYDLKKYLSPTSPYLLSEHAPFFSSKDYKLWQLVHPEEPSFFSTLKSCCHQSPVRPILLYAPLLSSPHNIAQLVNPLKSAHAYTSKQETLTVMNNILKLTHSPAQNGFTLLYDPCYSFNQGVALTENFLTFSLPPYTEETILQLGQEDGSSREFLPPYEYTFDNPQRYPYSWFVLSPKSASEIPESIGQPPTLPESINIALPLDPGVYKLYIRDIPQETEDSTTYNLLTYFSIQEPTIHIITLDEENWHSNLLFDYITLTRISPFPKKTTILEPAGYLASAKQEFTLPNLLVSTYYMIESNTPYIRTLTTLTRTNLSKEPVLLSLGFKGYKTLRAYGKEYNNSAEFENAPYLFSLLNSPNKPDIGIVLNPKGGAISLKWSEEEGVMLTLNFSGKYALGLAVVVEDGLYDHMSLYQLAKPFRDELPVLTLPPNSTQTRTNLLEVPISYTYRITNPKPTPYMVCETGSDGVSRWYYRPAIPSQTNPGEAYLKLYFQPKGLATISTQRFLADSIRFVAGSQYILAFSNITRDSDTISFTADVLYSHPLILAPTIQINGTIKSATLNGRDWCYFEGDLLRLPNKEGTYKATVKLSGTSLPHLERTYATVNECWYSESENSLTITLSAPPSWDKENKLYALINCAGKKIKEVQGATLIKTHDDKAVLSFSFPTIVKILFSP